MSHTPGPWFVVGPLMEDEVGIAGGIPLHVAAANRGEEGTHDIYDDLTEADAHVIAAAPELLAACVEFVRKCDVGEARSVRSYAQMKAAIAKAEGR